MTVVYPSAVRKIVENRLLWKTHHVGIDWYLSKHAVSLSIHLHGEILVVLLPVCAVLDESSSRIEGFRFLAPTSLCLLATTGTGA